MSQWSVGIGSRGGILDQQPKHHEQVNILVSRRHSVCTLFMLRFVRRSKVERPRQLIAPGPVAMADDRDPIFAAAGSGAAKLR